MINIETTIQKWGNSHAIRIPKPILDLLFLKEDDKVELRAVNDHIVVTKASRRRRSKTSLEERFKDYGGSYVCNECYTGKPVGNEVW